MSLPSVIRFFKTGEYTIKRTVAGSVTLGRYTEGVTTTFKINASIQPVTGRMLENLQEYQASMTDKVIYTEFAELKTRSSVQEPDVIVITNQAGVEEDWEIYMVEHFNVISSHWRALATRLKKP